MLTSPEIYENTVVMRSSSIDEDLGWEIINFMTSEMDTFRLNIPLWKNLISLARVWSLTKSKSAVCRE